MAEYIEREEIMNRLFTEYATDSKADVFELIRSIPAADVQPVKRGHWYHNTSKYVSELDAYFVQACCSCCKRYSHKIDNYTGIMSNNYCSYCGADMRGDENG